LEVFFALPVHW